MRSERQCSARTREGRRCRRRGTYLVLLTEALVCVVHAKATDQDVRQLENWEEFRYSG